MSAAPVPDMAALRQVAEELLEASANATPGPWEYSSGYYGWDMGIFPVAATDKLNQAVIANNGHGNGDPSPVDATYIVLSRTAGPELAQGVLALIERMEALEAGLQDLYDCQNGSPLPSYEKIWQGAMDQASALLARASPPAPQPGRAP